MIPQTLLPMQTRNLDKIILKSTAETARKHWFTHRGYHFGNCYITTLNYHIELMLFRFIQYECCIHTFSELKDETRQFSTCP